MLIVYSFYLNANQISEPNFVCDPITQKVAYQTTSLLNSVNIKANALQHSSELSIKLMVNNQYVARVVEGCNAVSVIILFIAFVLAFSGSFFKTLIYIILGSYIIYYINIARIAFIAVAIYFYPEYSDFFHQILFPLIIYGVTFMLWVVWVNFLLKKKNEVKRS